MERHSTTVAFLWRPACERQNELQGLFDCGRNQLSIEVLVDDIADQVRSRRDTRFIEDSPLVGADSLQAEVHCGSDLADAFATSERRHNLRFLGRQAAARSSRNSLGGA